MKNWISKRLKERTTLDGVALIVICGSVIVQVQCISLMSLQEHYYKQ
jgi:hypothetical protein